MRRNLRKKFHERNTIYPRIKFCSRILVGQNSQVCITTRYVPHGSVFETWWREILQIPLNRPWALLGLLYKKWRSYFQVLKARGRSVHHLPPSSTEVQLYINSPSVPPMEAYDAAFIFSVTVTITFTLTFTVRRMI